MVVPQIKNVNLCVFLCAVGPEEEESPLQQFVEPEPTTEL